MTMGVLLHLCTIHSYIHPFSRYLCCNTAATCDEIGNVFSHKTSQQLNLLPKHEDTQLYNCDFLLSLIATENCPVAVMLNEMQKRWYLREVLRVLLGQNRNDLVQDDVKL